MNKPIQDRKPRPNALNLSKIRILIDIYPGNKLLKSAEILYPKLIIVMQSLRFWEAKDFPFILTLRTHFNWCAYEYLWAIQVKKA